MAIYLPVGSLLYIDTTPRYNAALTYSPGDKVYYSGLLWKRKTGALTTIGQTPASGSTFWESNSEIDWVKLSEHNRQPLSLEHNRIEKSQRMSNGTLRKFFIADKKNFSTSWDMLPSFKDLTVDGGLGAVDLQRFYSNVGVNTFNIKIFYGREKITESSTVDRIEYYKVNFTSCSFSVIKRNVKGKTIDPAQEFWSASISMEQV
jgi:hypothetical protein